METINIAVIGADGVGKSAFIQRALRLPRPPGTNITAIRLDIEGVPHIVTLIELDLEFFDVDPRQQIKWPKQINGHMVPRIDGALILYDVMNRESVKELPPTLCKTSWCCSQPTITCSGNSLSAHALRTQRPLVTRTFQPFWWPQSVTIPTTSAN